MNLSNYLKQRSVEICRDNECQFGCLAGEHHCESYAYVNADGELLDICQSDYFQGCSAPYAAIALPWNGTQAELDAEVESQCAEMGEV